MSDVVDQLRAANEMAVKSGDLPISGVIQRAIDEIERLRSLVGKADVGPSFRDVTNGVSRRSVEPADPR